MPQASQGCWEIISCLPPQSFCQKRERGRRIPRTPLCHILYPAPLSSRCLHPGRHPMLRLGDGFLDEKVPWVFQGSFEDEASELVVNFVVFQCCMNNEWKPDESRWLQNRMESEKKFFPRRSSTILGDSIWLRGLPRRRGIAQDLVSQKPANEVDKADMGYVNVSRLQWGEHCNRCASLRVALWVLSFSLKLKVL